jgi:hypothetical protein
LSDIRKFYILQEVIEGKLQAQSGSIALRLYGRYISRLKKRVIRDGFKGLLILREKRPSPRKTPVEIEAKVLELRNKLYY